MPSLSVSPNCTPKHRWLAVGVRLEKAKPTGSNAVYLVDWETCECKFLSPAGMYVY